MMATATSPPRSRQARLSLIAVAVALAPAGALAVPFTPATLDFIETADGIDVLLGGNFTQPAESFSEGTREVQPGGSVRPEPVLAEGNSDAEAALIQVFGVFGPGSIGSGSAVFSLNSWTGTNFFLGDFDSRDFGPALGFDAPLDDFGMGTLDGSGAIDGVTFGDLGVTAGTEFGYFFNIELEEEGGFRPMAEPIPDLTVRFSADTTVIPLPAALPLMLGGLGLLGLMGWRRRRG